MLPYSINSNQLYMCYCSVVELSKKLEAEGDFLVWDKDHAASLDFVTAATNLRIHIFGLKRLSQFEVKCKLHVVYQASRDGAMNFFP